MHRAVTCFPLAQRSNLGGIWIPATPDQSRELMWFRSRYPLAVNPEAVMRKQSAEFIMGQRKADSILSPNYVPRTVQFAGNLAPRQYQSVAADLWKSTRQLLLADGVGLGKTVSTLAALEDPDLRPCCIVLPPTLERQWVRKIAEFLPEMTTHVIKSTQPYDLNVLARCPACSRWLDAAYHQRCPTCRYRVPAEREVPDVILCSYSKLEGWPEYLAEVINSVVFEEAHALRRNESQKWQAASALASQVPYRLGLTATPLFNMGGEIWNIMECISPGYLGPKSVFRGNWCGLGGADREPKLTDPDAFGAYLRDSKLMLRRTAKDVGLKLGEVNHVVQEVESSQDIFKKETGRAEELARILMSESQLGRGVAMRAAGEFDQMMRQATGLAKAPFVAAFVEMLCEQDIPVVVWAWHLAVHDVLCSKLEKYSPARYTGQESKNQKDASIHRFVNGDTNVLIASLWSGEGLDGLQHRASTTVFAEFDWAWARMVQCVGRLDRDGQTDPVTAFYMLSEYGIDPFMAEVLEIKQNQLNGLIGEKKTAPMKKADSALAIRSLASKYLKRRAI